MITEPTEPTRAEPLPPDEVVANRARVVAALRSGDYAQGTGALRPSRDEYCCLGVVEDVRGAPWVNAGDGAHGVRDAWLAVGDLVLGADGVNETSLTGPAMRWLGVAESNPCVVYAGRVSTLVDLNDDHDVSFAGIADVLEAQGPDWDGSYSFCARRLGEVAAEESS